jgi:hypothetical protein
MMYATLLAWDCRQFEVLAGTMCAGEGAAHAPSPDARYEHPVLRSLDADGASPSWLRLSAHAGSRGMGSPFASRCGFQFQDSSLVEGNASD